MKKILIYQILALSVGVTTVAHAATSRPNILFIVADDMQANAISALGNPDIETPNLDELVRKGTVFSQAYTMGSVDARVGASTRATMLSGQPAFQLAGDVSQLSDEVELLPELLRQRGYVTFATGKWENGRQSFQRSFAQADRIIFGDADDGSAWRVHDYDEYGIYANEDARTVNQLSVKSFADASIDFLENRPRGIPFFAYVSLPAPQGPSTAAKKAVVPENALLEGEVDVLSPDSEPAGTVRGLPEDPPAELERYYAELEQMDRQVGRILDKLYETGMDDITLVVFTSDNGVSLGQHDQWGKDNLYEQSLRVPMVLRGPDIPRGEEYVSLCYQMDLFATVCELSETTMPEGTESKSLLPLLDSKAAQLRATLFAAYGQEQRSARDFRYKLIHYPVEDRYELFNLRIDPEEMENLYDSGEHGSQINRLRIQLEAWFNGSLAPVQAQVGGVGMEATDS